jgi:hypothetical protein
MRYRGPKRCHARSSEADVQVLLELMHLETTALRWAVLAVVLAATLLVQPARSQPAASPTKSAIPSSATGLEFPVYMRQKVVAGSTPVGSKVEAKLAVATLVNGVVVPQDAVFSGEVTESVAKSAAGPSRLAIRMDSVQWKNRSAPVVLSLAPKVYLTAWYYPAAAAPSPRSHDISPNVPDASHDSGPQIGAPGVYPGQRSPTSQPSTEPDRGIDKDPFPAPRAAASDSSKHRVPMKDVESTRTSEGAVTLSSKRSNIKLDKTTTCVFAAGDLAGGPG